MNEKQWDEQLKSFLHRTGEELKRAGEEIKTEAQRLMEEVKDPERRRKVKEGLKEVGTWAKKTAEDVAGMVEKGVKKAENAFQKATDRVGAMGKTPASAPAPRPSKPKAKRPAAKTIGGRKVRAKPSATAAKKTIGRKPS